MKKVFISQPMRGLTDEEIIQQREILKNKIADILEEEVLILPSFFEEFEPKGNIPVAYLGKSISLMAEADVVYFGGDWKSARGCKIEYEVAKEYGIDIIEECDSILA